MQGWFAEKGGAFSYVAAACCWTGIAVLVTSAKILRASSGIILSWSVLIRSDLFWRRFNWSNRVEARPVCHVVDHAEGMAHYESSCLEAASSANDIVNNVPRR